VKRPLLLLCGPRGVGKSSVGWQVFYDVMQSGVTSAYVDLDQVSFCRPAPEDDPDNRRVKVQNLARLWSVYEEAGAQCLVATGDVSHRDVVDAYAAAVPSLDMDICQLHANVDTLTQRLLARGRGEGPGIPGDELRGESVAMLTRLAAEAVGSAEDPQRDVVGDVHVVTDDQTVEEVATVVRAALGGWPKITDS
jgi:hypothetical protein